MTSTTDTKELLIEILTEELPALPFLKEWQNIPSKWNAKLAEFGLKAQCEIHFTPRRIAIFSRDFPIRSADEIKEFFGPPVSIAYTNGELSNAGQSFLKKADIQKNQIQTTTKEGKEVLYAKCVIAGVESKKILPKIVLGFLASLNFGKTMRWGDSKLNGGASFIRPIHNIMILLGGERINPLESSDFSECQTHYGVAYLAATKVHRDKGFEWIDIKGLSHYLQELESGGVILDERERERRILAQIEEIEAREGIEVKRDDDLLGEVVAIAEFPTALLGSFEERFLALPQEVIQTSARENQRYFVAHKKAQKLQLCNHFVFVANSLSKERAPIIKGNEKVLRARLSDAEFFYQNDIKKHFSKKGSENPLGNIAFVDGLGSMLDKTRREQAIGAFLCKHYGLSEVDSHNVDEALRLSKVDLLSEMVGEFPELQGIMGGYYALELDSSISKAIKEQYLPKDLAMPSGEISAVVAMSGKLDSLFSLFSIGKIPSGSKDPFALRRAANGVLKIVLSEVFGDRDFSLDVAFLGEIAKSVKSSGGYKEFDLSLLQGFFMERLESIFEKDISTQVFRSISKGENKQIQAMRENAKALQELLKRDDREELIAVFKRVANITKDMDFTQASFDSTLFSEEAEKGLYSAFEAICKQKDTYKNPKDFLEALFSLKSPLEEFFASVLVNDENPQIRANRKALIFAIYSAFKQVGDLKELAI